MAMKNPYQAYQENTVTTASSGDLTLMLYNGGIKNIKLARQAIVKKDITVKHTHLMKAQAIIKELMVTLNIEIEVSKSLLALYDFMNRKLVEANTTNDVLLLDEVEGLIIELRETWKQVVQLNRQQKFGQSGQA